jgi:hypothetical protein
MNIMAIDGPIFPSSFQVDQITMSKTTGILPSSENFNNTERM